MEREIHREKDISRNGHSNSNAVHTTGDKAL